MANKKPAIKSVHSKKELKKELAGKIASVLAELKNTVGEKEFQHRLKKAAKIFVQGLHSKDFSANTNGTEKPLKEAPPKKIKELKKAKTKNQKKAKLPV